MGFNILYLGTYVTVLGGLGVRWHGRPQGGQGGTCPPWNLKKMTSYAAVLQNALKFSLAPSALAIDALYLSLKRRKKRKNFRKMVDFWYGAPKTCRFFNVLVVLPPSGKISAGAHATDWANHNTKLKICKNYPKAGAYIHSVGCGFL